MAILVVYNKAEPLTIGRQPVYRNVDDGAVTDDETPRRPLSQVSPDEKKKGKKSTWWLWNILSLLSIKAGMVWKSEV
jgi:hypothetical protein